MFAIGDFDLEVIYFIFEVVWFFVYRYLKCFELTVWWWLLIVNEYFRFYLFFKGINSIIQAVFLCIILTSIIFWLGW
jgi:hypothetical protein